MVLLCIRFAQVQWHYYSVHLEPTGLKQCSCATSWNSELSSPVGDLSQKHLDGRLPSRTRKLHPICQVQWHAKCAKRGWVEIFLQWYSMTFWRAVTFCFISPIIYKIKEKTKQKKDNYLFPISIVWHSPFLASILPVLCCLSSPLCISTEWHTISLLSLLCNENKGTDTETD